MALAIELALVGADEHDAVVNVRLVPLLNLLENAKQNRLPSHLGVSLKLGNKWLDAIDD